MSGGLLATGWAGAEATVYSPHHWAYTAHYEADRPGILPGKVEIRRELAPVGKGVWRLSVKARDWGYWREEKTEFDWHARRPRPLTYAYRRQALFSERLLNARFDWQRERLTIQSAGQVWSQPLQPDSQNVLTCQLWLRVQVSEGHVQPGCHVSDGGWLMWRQALLLGTKQLTWSGQTYRAQGYRLHLSEQNVLTVWLVPELHFVPVQVSYAMPGSESLHMNLIKIRLYPAGSSP